MKKFILSTVLLLAGFFWQAQAQFFESFESGIPGNWTVINNGGPDGWVAGPPNNGSPQDGAQVASILFDPSAHDDYLISPQTTVVAGSTDQYSFFARNRSNPYPEEFNVLVSTTGTSPADFTLIAGPIAPPTGSWQEYVYPLTAYVGQTIYIAIQAISTNQFELYIDAVTLDGISSCPKPSMLTVANITTTTADLGWMDNAGASVWDIELGPAGFAPTGTPTATGVSNPYIAMNLIANTTYEFYVRANCGGGDFSTYAGPFAFSTACVPFGVFSENFDGFPDPALPNCWRKIEPAGTDVFTEPFGSFSTPNSLNLDNNGVNYAELYAITPSLTDLPSGTYQIRFRAKAAASIVAFEVGTMTDPTDPLSYTMVQVIATTTGYQEYIVGFTGTITDTYVAFKGIFGTASDDIKIDDVFWEIIPSCPKPSVLTATNITATTADLGWTDNAGASLWNVEIVPAGTTPSGTPTATGVSNPYTAMNLPPATVYEFYVQADCTGGDLSVFSGPFRFTTPCPTAFTPGYVEDFTSFIPLCWDEAGSGLPSAGPSGLGFGGAWVGDDFANTGTNQAANILLDSNTDQDWLISPTIDLSAGGYELKFVAAITDAFNSNPPELAGMGSDDEVQILISSDNGATWANLLTYNQAGFPSPTGDVEFIDLATYTSATTKFAIWGSEGTVNDPESYEFFIDDFEIRAKPTCAQPTNLAAGNFTPTTADLSWTENNTPPATKWNIEYGLTGFTLGSGTTINDNDGTPSETITGLTANTDYDFYVSAVCGPADQSAVTGPFAFTTACGQFGDFSENFDNTTGNDLPDCWGKIEPAVTDVYTVSFGSFSTPNSLILDNDGVDNAELYAITPSLTDLPSGTYQIRFQAKADASIVAFEVGTMTDPADPLSYTMVQVIPTTAGYQEYIVGFTGTITDTYVAFKGIFGTASDDINIDDVFWEVIPPCPKPLDLTVTNIAQTTADLSWNASTGSTNGYIWKVFAAGANPTTATPVAQGTTPSGTTTATAMGLIPQTAYEAYVQADCGAVDGQSILTGPVAFSTLCVAVGIPFSEDFSTVATGAIPACWSTTSATNSSVVATCGGSRTNVLQLQFDVDVTTGPIDGTTSTTGLKVSYIIGEDVCGAAADAMFEVEYWNGTAWVVAKTYDPTGPISGIHIQDSFIVPQSDVTANFQLRFDSQEDSTTDDWSIDDLVVVAAPTCIAPTGLAVSNVAATSAGLSWNAVAGASNGYIWAVFNAGDVPGADVPVATGTAPAGTTTATATGLTAQTAYDAYVQADCGITNGQSILAGPFAFSTPCVAVAIPYSEDFSTVAAGAIPACWSSTSAANSSVIASCGARTNVLQVNNGVDVTTVPIDGTTSTTGLKVSYVIGESVCDTDSTEDNFEVEYWNGSAWVVVKTYDPDGPIQDTYIQNSFLVPQSEVTANFQVRFDNGDDSFLDNWSIDDLLVEAGPDYVYQNNAWAPSDPSGFSTSADDIIVVDGTASFTTATQMNNLTVQTGAVLNIEAAISPSGNIENNGSIVFVNDAVKLGQLADMTGLIITGSGETTVQRYIPARDDGKGAYRYIASAVNSTGNINSDWQEGAATIAENPSPGFGMFITGATTGANGFDATPAGAPSVFTFDEGTQAYVGIPNTDVDMLQAGSPHVAYIWGDRSVDIISTSGDPVATTTTLRATGNLVVGTQSSNGSSVAGGFNLFGNPYQAIIDMGDVMANAGTANVNPNFYYVWDPNIGTRGAYSTVNLPGGGNTGGHANQFLQPGQAAWAAATGGASTIAFEENDKDVTATPTDVFRPANMAGIELQLFQTNRFANGQSLSDAVRVNFAPIGNNAVTLNDAPKLSNYDENLALVNGTELLAIENRALPIDGEVLQLHNDQYRVADYTFKAIVNGLASNVVAYLNDAYLGTQTKLANGQETLVAFSMDATVPTSIAPNRFSIEFKAKGLSIDDVLANGFELYPNPAENGGFFIAAPGISGETQIALYNLLGQKVRNIVDEMGSDGRIRVETHNLEAGVYMVEVTNNPAGKSGSGQAQTFVDKLIIE